MNDMPNDERDPASSSEAIGYKDLPEWLQREQDEIAREEARDRLWIGLAVMVVIVAFILGLNAWLGSQGYGA